MANKIKKVKHKTHSGAKKRLKKTKSGLLKFRHSHTSHLLNGHGKTTKRKRQLRKRSYLKLANSKSIRRLLSVK
ncbi:MAG: 50S ribosomal protein L35 [Clostridiales bacterium]|jgi:large subunit ribosomal protein L35|nr:50S ribosomal protein L35 [Clostridiales bacterium]